MTHLIHYTTFEKKKLSKCIRQHPWEGSEMDRCDTLDVKPKNRRLKQPSLVVLQTYWTDGYSSTVFVMKTCKYIQYRCIILENRLKMST